MKKKKTLKTSRLQPTWSRAFKDAYFLMSHVHVVKSFEKTTKRNFCSLDEHQFYSNISPNRVSNSDFASQSARATIQFRNSVIDAITSSRNRSSSDSIIGYALNNNSS